MHIYHWFHFDGLNDEFSSTFICSQTASLANWQVKVGWCSHKPASAATEAEASAFNTQDTHNKSRNTILEWTCIHCVYTITQICSANFTDHITYNYNLFLITSHCIAIVWIIRKTSKTFRPCRNWKADWYWTNVWMGGGQICGGRAIIWPKMDG